MIALKSTVKWGLRWLKKGEYVKFKNYERKIKSPFMMYVNFKSILMSEKNNEKQNPD